MSEEDLVVLQLARRLRATSAAEYARFLRLAAKSLAVAELASGDPAVCVDLTTVSVDGIA